MYTYLVKRTFGIMCEKNGEMRLNLLKLFGESCRLFFADTVFMKRVCRACFNPAVNARVHVTRRSSDASL